MGFATGLHTGGMYPERLADVLPLLDWVGLDIKGPKHRYDAITGVPGSGERAWESLRIALEFSIELECRTTWHAGLFDQEKLHVLGQELARWGAKRWVVQECRSPDAVSWLQAEPRGPWLLSTAVRRT